MKTTLNHSTSLYPRSSGKIQLKRQAKYDMNNVKQELVVSSVSGNEIAKKKRNTRKHELTIDQMKQYFEYSQSQAARLLGVSVSTLKRRYYKLGLGKWPYPLCKQLRKKRSISYVLNDKELDEKFLDSNTINRLWRAFAIPMPDCSPEIQQSSSLT